MLLLRNAQLGTLRDSAQARFEGEMLAHLRAVSPRVRKTPDDALRRMVHEGIGRAREQGFNLRGPVRLFLELRSIFGSEFHSDPQYEWAGATLANASRDPQILVARRLYQQAKQCQSRVLGPQYAYFDGALRRIPYLAQPNVAADALATRALEVLARVYPEKAHRLGEQPLRALLSRSATHARRNGLPEVQGGVLLAGFALVLGHGYASDPLQPWIAQILADKELAAAPEAKMRQLAQGALHCLVNPPAPQMASQP